MNHNLYGKTTKSIAILILLFHPVIAQNSQDEKIWKAGTAKEIITPQDNLWMAGFAARTKPAEGKLTDLWVKALVLEDNQRNRALLITTDIIGYSRELSQAVCNRIMKKHHLERKNIILNASHTHSCPAVNRNLFGIYPPFDEEMQMKIEEYLRFLEDRIVLCADEAFEHMEPARIFSGVGIARFAVNRRNNRESDVLYSSDLEGPYDHTVPVIRISDPEDHNKVLLFGYACHATTLYGYKYSGDYPGFTQMELEKSFAGVTAMFFQGCGADQNGIPRGTVPLAQQYGSELADAVKRVLKEPMKELSPVLTTQYNEIELPFADPLSIRELDEIIKDEPPYQQRWALQLEKKIEKGEKLPDKYPYYPVQTWQLGDQILVVLGGEVVVDYAIRIKNTWGNDLFIAGYSNDVMAYIPSVRVLEEGGYEGDYSMRAYGQPANWTPQVEENIIDEVNRQVGSLRKTGMIK